MSTSNKVFCLVSRVLTRGRKRGPWERGSDVLYTRRNEKNPVPIEQNAFDISRVFWGDKSAVFWIAKEMLAVMGILILM